MKLYSENENYKLYQGNMLDMLEIIEKESIDSVVCDPPYELNFMSKGWDNAGVSFQPDTWRKCYEVLKPGGYLLAFGGSRTFHRIACAIEDAGFEIRDTICWMYGSGFPKSMALDKALEGKITTGNANKTQFHKLSGEQENKHHYGFTTSNKEQGFRPKDYTIEGESNTYLKKLEPTTDLAKKYSGWGTCLKPSFEPIIVARKPFKGSLVDNVIEYGVGGINIDECRVETDKNDPNNRLNAKNHKSFGTTFGSKTKINKEILPDNGFYNSKGRFPANTILTYDETDFDEVCGGFPDTKSNGGKQTTRNFTDYNGGSCNSYMNISNRKINTGRIDTGYIAPCDSGSASRYFYCAKASKKDRDEGLDEFETKSHAEINNRKEGSAGATRQYGGGTNPFLSVSCPRKNTHPTVKPTELMQYLVRLVTPNGGTVLDPFNGSGSTGKAVMYENKERNKNYKYIGIELTEEYLPIAKARIEYVCNLKEDKLKDMQMSIFDYLESKGE